MAHKSPDPKSNRKGLRYEDRFAVDQYYTVLRNYPPGQVPPEEIHEMSLSLNSLYQRIDESGVDPEITKSIRSALNRVSTVARHLDDRKPWKLEHTELIHDARDSLKLAITHDKVIKTTQLQKKEERQNS